MMQNRQQKECSEHEVERYRLNLNSLLATEVANKVR